MGKKQEEKHDDREENVFDVDICFTNESFLDRKKPKKFSKGAHCLHNFLEYYGYNCYFPVGFNRCFVECLDYLLDLKSSIEHLWFLKHGQRNQVMTQAKFQPFCNIAIIDR